jgi:hypothetical protein
MINVFIIHSGRDYDRVKQEIEPYLVGENRQDSSCNLLTLESGKGGSWKKDAGQKIKMAHAIIVVVGKDASDPSKKDTMGWEVGQAVKNNKLIMIYNPDQYELPDYLMTVDRFTRQKRPVGVQMTPEQIKTRIDDYARGYYDIFSPAFEELNEEDKIKRKNEIVDQYKLFQKTSEDLVTRRQGVNSFYITVNSALTALLGVVLGVFDSSVTIFVVVFMCAAGIILDISWINILEAYGTLNSAKLKVINLLEEQLPIALYDAEWRIMSDKLNNKKYVSFTDSEKRIPKLFMAIYCLIIVGMAAVRLLHIA